MVGIFHTIENHCPKVDVIPPFLNSQVKFSCRCLIRTITSNRQLALSCMTQFSCLGMGHIGTFCSYSFSQHGSLLLCGQGHVWPHVTFTCLGMSYFRCVFIIWPKPYTQTVPFLMSWGWVKFRETDGYEGWRGQAQGAGAWATLVVDGEASTGRARSVSFMPSVLLSLLF